MFDSKDVKIVVKSEIVFEKPFLEKPLKNAWQTKKFMIQCNCIWQISFFNVYLGVGSISCATDYTKNARALPMVESISETVASVGQFHGSSPIFVIV